MSLIECPECSHEVSSYAHACPHCGFPVFEALQGTVDELTGSDRARKFRQVAAAHNLEKWADRYGAELDSDQSSPVASRSGGGGERTTKVLLGVFAVVVVILQLIWVYSAVVR